MYNPHTLTGIIPQGKKMFSLTGCDVKQCSFVFIWRGYQKFFAADIKF